MIARLPASLKRASARTLRLLRRFQRARAGIAAVEFAFILPMMLVLYFGIVVLGQGLEVGRKVQTASHTLADLAAQTLPSTSGTGNCASVTTKPCLTDADLNDIFIGAQLVMTPFPTGASVLKATISEVIFDNLTKTATSGCCRARVMWSAGFGTSPTLRACGVLTSSANGTNGAALMPVGNYPGGAGDPLNPSVPPATYSVAAGTSNATDYYLIVADITYLFQPGYDFKLFNWGRNANGGQGYTITQTTYMTPRYGAATPIVWNPDGTIAAGKYNNCPCVTSSSASCTVGAATASSSAATYNTP
jgi:Flp pilus assembly protein TadG